MHPVLIQSAQRDVNADVVYFGCIDTLGPAGLIPETMIQIGYEDKYHSSFCQSKESENVELIEDNGNIIFYESTRYSAALVRTDGAYSVKVF